MRSALSDSRTLILSSSNVIIAVIEAYLYLKPFIMTVINRWKFMFVCNKDGQDHNSAPSSPRQQRMADSYRALQSQVSASPRSLPLMPKSLLSKLLLNSEDNADNVALKRLMLTIDKGISRDGNFLNPVDSFMNSCLKLNFKKSIKV